MITVNSRYYPDITGLLKQLADVQPISATFFNKPVYKEENIKIRAKRRGQEKCATASILKPEIVFYFEKSPLTEEERKAFIEYWDNLIEEKIMYEFICEIPETKWPEKKSSFSDEYSKRFVRITGP